MNKDEKKLSMNNINDKCKITACVYIQVIKRNVV